LRGGEDRVRALPGDDVAREHGDLPVEDHRLVDLPGGDPDLRAEQLPPAAQLPGRDGVEQHARPVDLADAGPWTVPDAVGVVHVVREAAEPPRGERPGRARDLGGLREQRLDAAVQLVRSVDDGDGLVATRAGGHATSLHPRGGALPSWQLLAIA
jgi:hypothetical protein